MQTSSNTDHKQQSDETKPAPVCPLCGGVGFLRVELPIDHPDFGKLQICSCRQSELAEDAQHRLYQLSNLASFRNMTFENFNPKGRVGLGEKQVESLNNAYRRALQYASQLNGWLLLMGKNGCGKTHLAAAIANKAVEQGVQAVLLTVPDLLDWIRFSYSTPDSSFEERFNEIRNIDLLILDDLGTQNATPWAKEKLFQILNHRYVKRLPTVITTNLDMMEIEERVRSRLYDPEVVDQFEIKSPDYRSPVQDTSHSQLSSLGLHSARTFGDFSLREHEKLLPEEKKSIEKAFHAAQKFAENPHGWLVFSGTYGTGKTHLAASIGNYRFAMGESPMFVVVPDLLDHLRATFSPSSTVSYDHVFKEILSSSLLILDDLSTQSATPWAREKLYQIMNYRYNAQLPTVITTANTIEDIDPRLRTRMLDKRICSIYAIDAPAYLIQSPRRTRSSS